jgi:hypothetical protein
MALSLFGRQRSRLRRFLIDFDRSFFFFAQRALLGPDFLINSFHMNILVGCWFPGSSDRQDFHLVVRPLSRKNALLVLPIIKALLVNKINNICVA